MNRRDFYRFGTIALGGLMGAVLTIPGVAYLLDPILRRPKAAGGPVDDDAQFRRLARLEDLPVGVPQSYRVVAARKDAWVQYPEEPVGSVWLVRQPDGAEEPVLAFSAECPHLGCGVNLSADGKSFACPCHTSSFTLGGAPTNEVPPRGMDRLQIRLSDDEHPWVRVRYQRFRSQTKESIPLA